jgi:hypothetical protein
MLSGESLFAQGTALGILAVWCVLSYLIALKTFRWV